MKFKKRMTKILAISLAAASLAGMAALPVSATVQTDQTVVKVSNPQNGQRQTDGLVEGGDRETSYAWCMAARGDYVYIGTNKNIVGSTLESIAAKFEDKGLSSETAWKIADVMTNGEIPHITTTEGGQILRVNCKTNEIDVIHTAPAGTSFRMAITHGKNVFFGSYSTDASFAANNGEGLSNDIFRIDENDNVEKVFASFDGTSMRAACEYKGKLYFGGVDASEEIDAGWEGSAKLAILVMDEDNNENWSRVADYKDFGLEYAKDPSLNSAAASPVWDICEFDGDLYATLPGSKGFSVFKGHPKKEGETANEYGWTWKEVVGFNNGVNPIGLREEGENVNGQSPLSVVATPVVFKGELYLFDFDHTIGAETKALTGIVSKMLGADVKASNYLRPMYNTLRHTQSLWKYNKETGKFEKVEAFSKLLENTTNEYVWRAQEYNGELYITTMDSAVLYNYVTKLTNGNFITASKEEVAEEISYIYELLKELEPFDGKYSEYAEKIDAAKAKVDAAKEAFKAKVDAAKAKADAAKEKVDEKVDAKVEEAKAKLLDAAAKLEEIKAQLEEKVESSEQIQELIAKLESANAQVKEAVETIKQKLAENEKYQQYLEFITSKSAAAKEKMSEISAKIKEYLQSKLDAEIVEPEDVQELPKRTDFSTMSDEELTEYFNAISDKLNAAVEKMNVEIPEIKNYDTETVLEMTKKSVEELLADEGVQALIEDYAAKLAGLDKKDTKFRQYLKNRYVAAITEKIASIPDSPDTQKLIDEFVTEYNARADKANAQITELNTKLNEVYTKARENADSIDWEGLKMYAYISDMVKNDTWGFDMIKTADGENFEVVTNDGFGDKYNYGGRSMAATPYGLYVGTANPFYGAQLFVLNNNKTPEEEVKLENTSSLNSYVAQIGDTIKIKGSAANNTGDVTYSYYFKRAINTRWIAIGDKDTTSTVANLVPKGAAEYDIKVVAKDSTGETAEKIMKLSVSETMDFTNVSDINVGDTSEVGKTIIISGRSVGGGAPVTYQYYFKRSTNTSWKNLKAANKSGSYAKFAPTAAATYEIKVVATNKDGVVSEKYFTVTTTTAE